MLVSSGTAVLVPQTMLSVSADVPHTMLSCSPADDVPRTMLSDSPALLVPQTSPWQSSPPHSAPQTTFSSAADAVQTVFAHSMSAGSSEHCVPRAIAPPSG